MSVSPARFTPKSAESALKPGAVHLVCQRQRHRAENSMAADNTGSKGQHYLELTVVFDFFTDNPQKVLPLSESNHAENPFYDPYWGSIRAMQQNDQFLEGMLLRSVDSNAKFPYLHYVVFNNSAPLRSQRATSQDRMNGGAGGGGLVSSKELMLDSKNQLINILNSQGGYSEMFSFVDPNVALLPKRPSNPNTAYIVSAFRTSGNLPELDSNWSYWSGADYISSQTPSHLHLQRITFHKIKYSTQSSENFTYVLMCELGEALADVNKAREIVDSLKFRQCGYASLYTIDHFF